MVLLVHDPTNQPAFRFAQRISTAVETAIRSASVPVFAADLQSVRQEGSIYVVDRPPIRGVASGTLLAVGEEHFLITAAHVAAEFQKAGRQLRIGMGDPERPRPLSIDATDLATDEVNDVAAIRLNRAIVSQLRGKRFIGLNDVACDDESQDWHYVISGYLWDGTHANADFTQLHLHNFTFWTRRYEGRLSNLNYDPSQHVLMQHNQAMFSVAGGFQTSRPASLHGLSGASVWRAFLPEHEERGWSPNVVKVVAVENIVYGDRVIGCTKWKCVAPLLAALCPDMEPQIKKRLESSGDGGGFHDKRG